MDERSGIDGLEADLAAMADFLTDRAAANARVIAALGRLVGDGAPAARAARDRLAGAWAGRTFHAVYDRPLLLLAAIRADALAAPDRHPLARAVAPAGPDAEPDPDAVTPGAVLAALAGDREALWRDLAARWVQTNETTRAVAWRWPARLAGCDRGARPLALVDVGASAGLNLVADALPAPWLARAGVPLQVASDVCAVARVGLDARPLDVGVEADARWLRACVWAGDRDRLARLDAVIEAMRAALAGPSAPELRACDATAFASQARTVERALPAGGLLLVYQTVVRDYLSPQVQAEHERGMRALLGDVAPGRAVWIELETAPGPGAGAEPAALPAQITAHVAAGGRVETLVLGRCQYHPVEVEADAGAAAAFAVLARNQAV